jgi:hypothetical protein
MLKRCLSVVVGCLCLLALAGFMVLTNTVALVITLAVLAAVIFVSSRLVLSGTQEGQRKTGTR